MKTVKLCAVVLMVLVVSSVSQALVVAPWGDWDDGMDPSKFNGAVGVNASDSWGQVFTAGSAVPGGEPNPWGGDPFEYMPDVAGVEIFPWSSTEAYTFDVTLEVWNWYGAGLSGSSPLYTETFSPINVPAWNTAGVLLELTTPVSIDDIGGITNYAVIVKADSGGLWISTYGTDGPLAGSVNRLIRNGVLQLATQDMAMTVYSTPEPATIGLLALGGLVLRRKKR